MILRRNLSVYLRLCLAIAMGGVIAACSQDADAPSNNQDLNLLPAINVNCGETSCVR